MDEEDALVGHPGLTRLTKTPYSSYSSNSTSDFAVQLPTCPVFRADNWQA